MSELEGAAMTGLSGNDEERGEGAREVIARSDRRLAWKQRVAGA
jgi:hypothetical protein